MKNEVWSCKLISLKGHIGVVEAPLVHTGGFEAFERR